MVQDVPPFMIADGHSARAYGINSVGLDRAKFPREEKQALKQAFKIIFKSGLTLANAVEKMKSDCPPFPSISILLNFLKESKRGICR